MKKYIKYVLVIFIGIALYLFADHAGFQLIMNHLSKAPVVPDDYTSTVRIGGNIEEKYLAMGDHPVKQIEVDHPSDSRTGTIRVWYPAELSSGQDKYPLVLYVNGSGLGASRYSPVFEHLASWGFIAAGNEDSSSRDGSADLTLTYLLELNDDPDSVFYQRIDTDYIGIVGYSTGCIGLYDAINMKDMYKCAVCISPPSETMAAILGMPYDPSKIHIPVLMLCGGRSDIISVKDLIKVYEKAITPRAMGVRSKANHREMLYAADGYVTAWLMWYLQDEQEVARAFNPPAYEFIANPLYQDPDIWLNILDFYEELPD